MEAGVSADNLDYRKGAVTVDDSIFISKREIKHSNKIALNDIFSESRPSVATFKDSFNVFQSNRTSVFVESQTEAPKATITG